MTKALFRIGAKDLAKMRLPNFCARCFWYYLHCKPLPFNSFPGIFNEFDLLQKCMVHAYIDEKGCPPPWMGDACAKMTGYKEVGFLDWEDEENGIVLRGGPDVVLHNKNESEWFVGDYKTARYRDGNDTFLPQYEGQLLGYSFLLTKNGFKTPKSAALLYMGPKGEPTQKELLSYITKTGYTLSFSVDVIDIELGKFDLIHTWLKKTREIYDCETPPEGRDGCKNCKRIDAFIKQGKEDPRRHDKLMDLGFSIPDRYGRKKRMYTIVKDEVVVNDDQDRYEWLPDWND